MKADLKISEIEPNFLHQFYSDPEGNGSWDFIQIYLLYLKPSIVPLTTALKSNGFLWSIKREKHILQNL